MDDPKPLDSLFKEKLFRIPDYPKAVKSLRRDQDRLLTFYDFPAEHWKYIRTSNPIESSFATVRLRQDRLCLLVMLGARPDGTTPSNRLMLAGESPETCGG